MTLNLFVTVVSQSVFLGSLREFYHQTRGDLYAINEKTFFIDNFNYDGTGDSKYNNDIRFC